MKVKSKNRELVDRIIEGSEPATTAVNFLQSQVSGVAPKWDILKRQWDPAEHPAAHKAQRLRVDHPERSVQSIGIADQQRYVRRAIDLMFSKPVTREWETKNELGEPDTLKEDIAKTIEAVLSQVAYDALNRDRFVPYFGACQMATIWESYQKTDRKGVVIKQKYGDRQSDYKIACKTYSPMAGDKIHPVYDGKGDLVLLGIDTYSTVLGEKEHFFIIMSAQGVQTYQQVGGTWERLSEELEAFDLGKIPAAFIERGTPIWGDTSAMTYERENKVIDNAMVIDFNSVPDRVVNVEGDNAEEDLEALQIQMGIKKHNAAGEVVDVPAEERVKKARFSRNYMGKGISMTIQEWSGATEALKYHMETLQRLQDDDIGLPDLTPNAISNISTDTLQLILEVSALRVISESGAIEKFMRREVNLCKELIKQMYKPADWQAIDDLEYKVKIHPLQISNEAQRIQNKLLSNGNKPIDSWENSVKSEVGQERFKEVWSQLQGENAQDIQIENLNL